MHVTSDLPHEPLDESIRQHPAAGHARDFPDPLNTFVQLKAIGSPHEIDLCRNDVSSRDIEEPSVPRQVVSLTLEDARRIIAAGERQAVELKIPYNIAVVDAGGALVAHVRMDGARQGFGLNTTNHCRVVIFGGGIPVRAHGTVIGAVGASGGSVEQDILVARAALAGMTVP
jgi:uncharacterized protein GlcG (DUF336 family)